MISSFSPPPLGDSQVYFVFLSSHFYYKCNNLTRSKKLKNFYMRISLFGAAADIQKWVGKCCGFL